VFEQIFKWRSTLDFHENRNEAVNTNQREG